MKALFLFPRFGIGGIAKAMSFVARICDENNMKVVCISMSDEPIMIDLPEKAKTKYLIYKTEGKRAELIINKLWFLCSYRRIMRQENPDIIISFGTDLVRITRIASIGMKTKIIGSERGNPYVYSNRQRKKYIGALRRCRRIVFQTTQAMDYYPDEIKNKSVIIPNPCVGKILTRPDSGQESKNKKVILVFSRISPEKNIMGIVKAFVIFKENAKLSEQSEEFVNTELHIYGDGSEKKQILDEVQRRNITDIKFFDSVPNVLQTEAEADVYVINSETEGFPNSLIEAMLAGIPCIASDCPPGGVNFIADHGRRVHLVPVHDEKALADGMAKVLTDKAYADMLRKNAMEIKDVLDPVKLGRNWMNLIQEVISGE